LIKIKCKRLIGSSDLVPIVMELTPPEVEKISEGVLFDLGADKLLWLTQNAWILIQVKDEEVVKG
jgi:hypothetical protein